MKPKKLIGGFEKLQNELNEGGPNAKWTAMRSLMVVMTKTFQLQVEHDDLQAEMWDGSVDTKPTSSLSAKDRKDLEKAAAINRQIGKALGDIKRAKKAKKEAKAKEK